MRNRTDRCFAAIRPRRRLASGHARRRLAKSVLPAPRGFTLIEVLLVLALLIVLSAITWPSLGRMIARQDVERGVSDVHVLLATARVRATDVGATYQFRYELGGRNYVLIPADPAELVAVADSPVTDTATAASTAWKRSGQLPESVTFQQSAGNMVLGDPIAPELLAGLDRGDELSRAAWGPAILFHPDGTATDSSFLITNDDEESVTFTIRGLTGAARSETTIVEDQP